MKLISSVLVWLLLACGVQAQGPILPGPGLPVAGGASYTGPGDAQTFLWFGSCTFAYSAALATTTTSLCDLVASGNGAAVCTLRASSAGSVDQTAYCPGSTTPSAACAAANGGSCRVTKVYDQIGGTGGWSQATLSKMPDFSFAGIGSLPSIVCDNSAGRLTALISGNVSLQNQPYTFYAVAGRTSLFTQAQTALASNPDTELGWTSTADQVSLYANGSVSLNLSGATDGSAHVMSGAANGASSTLNVDGLTQASGTNPGTGAIAASPTSACGYVNGVSNLMVGPIGEFGAYAATYNSTVHSNGRTRWGL